ncbi:MAG TPA: hypothetical protein VG538_14740 [Vicinamibacterales bacterium]|jgi:hypothetical protein|nr:hypothetical protein [Vicinamibacterales bacterium]
MTSGTKKWDLRLECQVDALFTCLLALLTEPWPREIAAFLAVIFDIQQTVRRRAATAADRRPRRSHPLGSDARRWPFISSGVNKINAALENGVFALSRQGEDEAIIRSLVRGGVRPDLAAALVGYNGPEAAWAALDELFNLRVGM